MSTLPTTFDRAKTCSNCTHLKSHNQRAYCGNVLRYSQLAANSPLRENDVVYYGGRLQGISADRRTYWYMMFSIDNPEATSCLLWKGRT